MSPEGFARYIIGKGWVSMPMLLYHLLCSVCVDDEDCLAGASHSRCYLHNHDVLRWMMYFFGGGGVGGVLITFVVSCTQP